MFYAYFDEGGHPADSEVVSIACVVAPVKQWQLFSNKWERILRRYKIQHGLHMTDFESRNGDFKDWEKHDQRAIPFISQLSSILTTHMQYGCVISVAMKDWNAVMRDRFPDNFERKRSPFIFLFQTCLEAIKDTSLLPKHEKIAFEFEETKFLNSAAPQHLVTYRDAWGLGERWGDLGFGKKYDHRPLEGADMLAYEGAKHVLNQTLHGGRVPERKLHEHLLSSKKIMAGFYDSNALWSYLEKTSEEELKFLGNP